MKAGVIVNEDGRLATDMRDLVAGPVAEAVTVVERLAPAATPLLGTLLAADLLAAAGAAQLAELVTGGRPGSVVLSEDLTRPAPRGLAWDWSEGALVVGLSGPVLLDVGGVDPLEPHGRGLARTRRIRCTAPTPALGRVTADRLARWRLLFPILVCADLLGLVEETAVPEALDHARRSTRRAARTLDEPPSEQVAQAVRLASLACAAAAWTVRARPEHQERIELDLRVLEPGGTTG